jgi:hypothetical protein
MINNYNHFIALNELKMTIPSLKISANDAQKIIKDNVTKFLEISEDKINDPENVAKLKDFLAKMEETSGKLQSALKKRRTQTAMIIVTGLGMYSSLIAGIWNAVFNSGLEHWWNPASFQVGGLFYFKLALFLFIIRLILKAYRAINDFANIISNVKGFINDVLNLFKKTKSEEKIQENLNIILLKYDLL